jgi:gas vesicle protein GvpL/GvpF
MPSSDNNTAVYVYGIVPADVELTAEAHGVGDPPSEVSIIACGDIAAMVSEVPRDRALGGPEDLRAHAQLLDDAADQMPVLPLRFGAVMTDADSVAEELLEAHHDEFRDALKQLEGHAEYIAKGRYVEQAVIRAVLEGDPKAAQLLDRIHGRPEDSTRQDRIALGELINNAIARRRERDTQRVAEALQSLGFLVSARPATHELDAFQVACLAETDRQGDLEEAIAQLSDEWQGEVETRLLGPLAPYDFVTTTKAKP